MSTRITTNIWLSPVDYKRRKIHKLLEDAGADFEFDDEEKSCIKPDNEGMIRLTISDSYSYDDLTALAAAGVSFYAREDSRDEADGNQAVWISYRKKTVYIQEDGDGHPVVRVQEGGKINQDDLKAAKLFWKLHAKVVASCLKKLAVPEAQEDAQSKA